MATDCNALAYQGAALSDTVRLASFLRPDFLVWRLMVFVFLTRKSLTSAPARLDLTVQGSSPGAISHSPGAVVKSPGAGQPNAI